MGSLAPAWVDHTDPMLRLGVASCLREASHPIVGQSAALQPRPDPDRTRVLLFELDRRRLDEARDLAAGTGMALVGLLRDGTGQERREPRPTGLTAVIPVRGLTAARLTWCVRAAAEPGRRLAAPPMGRTRAPSDDERLTDRERDVLRLLADGATTRDMAEHMNYSERTVKNIVHDVLVKLHTRTRAQAVAVAARRGVI